MTPKGTDWRYDDFTVRPFTFRELSVNFGRTNLLRNIPGTAPSLTDVEVGLDSGSAPHFGLIGWAGAQAGVENYITNGDFEAGISSATPTTRGTSGWLGTGGHTAGTSTISIVSTAFKFGAKSMQIVTPATTNAGSNFKSYRLFRKGVSYTFKAWVRSAAGTTSVSLAAGQSGVDSIAGSSSALSTTWQELMVTWVPTADRSNADFTVRQDAATVTTFTVDGAQVYETALGAPTGRQAEGAGGRLPFGVIEAESALPVDATNWAVSSSADDSGGFGLSDSVSNAETYHAAWLLDPTLLPADEFGEEVSIEVWGRFLIPSTLVSPKVTLTAFPEGATSVSARPTHEFGAAGKLLPVPPTGTPRRSFKLGTIVLPRGKRWYLNLAMTTATGSTGTLRFDRVVLVPSNARALSPSGKIYSPTTYPSFYSGVDFGGTKTIHSDLSGKVTQPDGGAFTSHGLGGSLIEFPAGNTWATTWLVDNSVPDDPNSGGEELLSDPVATVHFKVTPRSYLLRS